MTQYYYIIIISPLLLALLAKLRSIKAQCRKHSDPRVQLTSLSPAARISCSPVKVDSEQTGLLSESGSGHPEM